MRIRIVPTFSGKHTLQAVSKRLGKLTVHKHFGTFTTEEQKQTLLKGAKSYIKSQTGQEELFNPPEQLQLKNVIITQSQPLFLYPAPNAPFVRTRVNSLLAKRSIQMPRP